MKSQMKRFIPVLHNDGRMPTTIELPPDLQFLSDLPAIPLTLRRAGS